MVEEGEDDFGLFAGVAEVVVIAGACAAGAGVAGAAGDFGAAAGLDFLELCFAVDLAGSAEAAAGEGVATGEAGADVVSATVRT